MRRPAICIFFGIITVLGFLCAVHATMEEDAKVLARKVAVYFKENGREKGLEEINNPKGRFAMRMDGSSSGIGLSVNDFNGICLANQAFPKLVGQNHMTLRDASDKYFIREAIGIAKKGGGWLEVSFTNPVTLKIQRTRSWVEKVPGADLLVMVSGLPPADAKQK